ncbi:MAG: LuxR C-terminal-related transcriptional regulator [Rhodanobacteraceae bacterium]
MSDPASLAALSASLVQVVDSVAASVVSVHSHRSSSSGFAWKPDLIVTADEALAEEGEVAVTLPGGKRAAAGLVGRDPATDIALVRIESGTLAPVRLDGTVPPTGSLAVAVGSREGAPVAALGVVASSGPRWRSLRGGEIDARLDLAISLESRGEGGLACSASGSAFGMLARGPRRRVLVIPGATIQRIAAQLEAHGRVLRGYLGLGLQPVRLDHADGIGAMVMSVEQGGPAAAAGIHQGDIIENWDGNPITGVADLLRALGPSSVGTDTRRPDEPRALDAPLTPREIEVLLLLAEGASNKTIAARLDISVHTAKFHVGQLIAKLDATGRTDVVAHAARLGVLHL